MHRIQHERNWQAHISRFEVIMAVLPLILFFGRATICRWEYGSKILKGTWVSSFIYQDEVLLYDDEDDDDDDDDDDDTSFFRIRRHNDTSR